MFSKNALLYVQILSYFKDTFMLFYSNSNVVPFFIF